MEFTPTELIGWNHAFCVAEVNLDAMDDVILNGCMSCLRQYEWNHGLNDELKLCALEIFGTLCE